MSPAGKYNVKDGTHSATVEIVAAGANAFTGNVTSDEFGSGQITNGVIGEDGSLKGDIDLDGYDGDFSASVAADGVAIAGVINGPLWTKFPFTGAKVAA